ncbi:MAG TPA: hypothetical protein VGA51_05535 [Casimicrobiaceae bacterium]
MDKLATEGNATGRRGRVFNVHAGSSTADDLRNDPRERCNLGLQFGADRHLLFEYGNEYRPISCCGSRLVFRILVTADQAKSNPRLTGRRVERATNGVSERLRKIVLRCVEFIRDKIDRKNWHAA